MNSQLYVRRTPERLELPELRIPGKVSLGRIPKAELEQLYGLSFAISDYALEFNEGTLATVLFREKHGILVAAAQLVSPWFIHALAVRPDYQRQGLGRYLVYWIMQTFELPFVLAAVDDTSSKQAESFWLGIGFQEVL